MADSRNEKKIAGYSFVNEINYKEAKHEAESVEYIRANTNLTDGQMVLKLYNKLIDRKTFKTVVGYSFLKELQDIIVQQNIASREELAGILIDTAAVSQKNTIEMANALEHSIEEEYKKKNKELHTKRRNSRIINVFLTVIIIIMFLINIFSDRTVFDKYKEKVTNEYAAWDEELNSREKELNKREDQLDQREEALEKREQAQKLQE